MGQERDKKVDDDKESEGTIPNPQDGVGATSTNEANTFEEEEDPEHGPDQAAERHEEEEHDDQ